MKPRQTLLSFSQCKALTRKRTRCTYRHREGSPFCGRHQGDHRTVEYRIDVEFQGQPPGHYKMRLGKKGFEVVR